MPASGEAQERVFVIRTTDQEAVLALHGLAEQFGMDIRERTSDEPGITDANLEEISTELWGDPTYGRFASSYVDALRQVATTTVIQTRGRIGFHALNNRHFGLPISQEGTFADASIEEGELDELLTGLLDASDLPFQMDIARSDPDRWGPSRIIPVRDLIPQQLTAERLARYLRRNQIHEHLLHGTLGKGFDVLLRAAGVEIPERAARQASGPFISRDELTQMMIDTTDLTSGQRYGLLGALGAILARQIADGEADELGEVVVEGPCLVKGILLNPAWNQVAVSSVGSLFYRRRGAKQNVRSFLANFGQRYAAYVGSGTE